MQQEYRTFFFRSFCQRRKYAVRYCLFSVFFWIPGDVTLPVQDWMALSKRFSL
jgi:hypothetical protein